MGTNQPDVNPDGTAPMKAEAPKFAVKTVPAIPEPPPKVLNGHIAPAGMLMPVLGVPGSLPAPAFQLPEGATRNQILRLSRSTATRSRWRSRVPLA